MKWVTFHTANSLVPRVGVMNGRTIHAESDGLTLIDCFGESPRTFQDVGNRLIQEPHDTYDLDAVTLLPPLPSPPAIRDFMAFEEHALNATKGLGGELDPDWYELPVFYFTNPASIRGHASQIPIAPGSESFDYEVELASVIGWPGSDLSLANANSLIAGYCLFIDWSARDLQSREMRLGLGPAKGKDTASSLGPVLVTPDEVEPYRLDSGFGLNVTADVNGRTYTDSRFAEMHWSFEQMIVYASRGTAMRPGDIIASGTCGRGCIVELQALYSAHEYPWLADEDVVTVKADVLGSLTSTIVTGEHPRPLA